MDVSTSACLRDLRNDDSPGVAAITAEGICADKVKVTRLAQENLLVGMTQNESRTKVFF